jgi:hypothetical protein
MPRTLSVRKRRAIEPCLPKSAEEPPAGPGWIHEIKHDGFRIMARRDPGGVRLVTRKGSDFTRRFSAIAMAIAALPVRSCLIDGEAIVCDENGSQSSANSRVDGPMGRLIKDIVSEPFLVQKILRSLFRTQAR